MSRICLQKAYRSKKINNNGYTLVELAITLGVILILATFGIYFYFGALANARGTVCHTNQKTLKTAVEEYVSENDALPATLGHLKLEHLEKGYAKAMENMGWLTKLSLLLLKLDESGNAYAQFLTDDNLKKYGAKKHVFQCPTDGNGSPSYGINGDLEGRNWSEIGQEEIIVADCDQYVFTAPDQLAKRHDHQALAINKSGKIVNLPGTDDLVTICHMGITTKTKSGSALKDHLAHGDTVGACSGD